MKNLTILIYLKSRANKNGESPIYLRLSLNGKRVEKSLSRSIVSTKWNIKKQRAKGNAESIKQLNQYLTSVEHKLHTSKQDIENSSKTLTVESIMNRFLGTDKQNISLIEFVEVENKRLKKLIKAIRKTSFFIFI